MTLVQGAWVGAHREENAPVIMLQDAAAEFDAISDASERQAMLNAIAKLEVLGSDLPYPHASEVPGQDRLRELRPKSGRSPWRPFYRTFGDGLAIGAIGPEARVDPRGFARAMAAATQRLDTAAVTLGRTETPAIRLDGASRLLERELARDEGFRVEWLRLASARAIAAIVLRWRADRGLTRTALARLLGVAPPVVARLECGDLDPKLDALAHLVRGLGLNLTLRLEPANRGQANGNRSARVVLLDAGIAEPQT